MEVQKEQPLLRKTRMRSNKSNPDLPTESFYQRGSLSSRQDFLPGDVSLNELQRKHSRKLRILSSQTNSSVFSLEGPSLEGETDDGDRRVISQVALCQSK